MNKPIPFAIPRRYFLMSTPALILASSLKAYTRTQAATSQTSPKLPEELSPQEQAEVEKSILAKDLKNYFGKGYSCAESMLMVGLRYLKKPEELFWIAGGFGGGMYHRDVCGIVTGGIMALGLAAGQPKKERKEAQEWVKQKVQLYWTWWMSQAPLHCKEIRKEGTKLETCLRLGLLAAARIEELIFSDNASR
jgi:hypothetical protein